MPTLYIFDVDGTIADRDESTPYPNVQKWFDKDRDNGSRYAFATNQGGVGLRLWMERDGFGEPEKYPTVADVRARLSALSGALTGDAEFGIFQAASFNYQAKSGSWAIEDASNHPQEFSKDWRKPAGGMIDYIVEVCGGKLYDEIIFVGDSADDQIAASKSKYDVLFIWANHFFDPYIADIDLDDPIFQQ